MSREPLSRIVSLACRLAVVTLFASGGYASPAAAPRTVAADELSFNRDIRPLLSDACFACHGPDNAKRQGDLRLDLADAVFADPKKGVIVPGKPDESELIRRINSSDPAEVMPPPATKKSLTDAQRELLRKWIAQGARYQRHWAFEPIVKPAVPLVSPATPSPANPPANPPATPLASVNASDDHVPVMSRPIDGFLERRIRDAGLDWRPSADRETLIRRVAFALTGLPPTIKEVDAFLGDKAPNAYERMVDRYLAAPQFGEEMARHWLDAARYADTHGLHLDNERRMWAYRDWVVRAFNSNLPFDQFTIWQLAGDMLPNPTPDQLVATGFNRCNVTTSEGGSIEAEFVYRYAVERASTTAQVWLGLTAGCAVCHDHKYDPLTTKEFYSLYAFFHSAADPAMDGNIANTPPFLKLPRPELRAAADAASKVEREARAWLETLASQAAYRDPADKPVAEGVVTADAAAVGPIRELLWDDAFPLGTTSKSSSRNAVDWLVDPPFAPVAGRRVLRQAQAASYTDTIEFKLKPVVIPADGVLEVWLHADAIDPPVSVAIGAVGGQTVTWKRGDAGFVRDNVPKASEAPMVSPASALAAVPIAPGKWTKLSLRSTELGLKPGDRLNGVTLNQTGGIAYWDAMALVGTPDAARDPAQSLVAWRQRVGTTPPTELPAELNAAIQAGPDKPLSSELAAALRQFYIAFIARPLNQELAIARTAWEGARVARLIADDAAPGSMIYREMDKPRESFVMIRGQYDKPGERVEPAGPAILPPIRPAAPGARPNRLDLARWLVAADNPLTARVAVNRFWQQLFGTGLVKTSYDFGSQGEPPSHPELLDWLAQDFRESGWDMKRLVKQLVMTAAFRRDARLEPAVRQADPANRLYARGPRFRLDAEQVRDNALFVSGLINLEQGGRGVRPYQPANIWEPVGYSDSNTRFYLQDHGPALYRRSLYTFLKRTAPPPFMANFDAPNREQVCMARERSNTPLQALQLMNDTQHFEAARALAERVLAERLPTEAGEGDPARIDYLFRTVLARRPTDRERGLLTEALARQRELYARDAESARKAIQVGESSPRGVAPPAETAAWTILANLVLNLDETVNRN
jgi:mono/diheme cytochrome c family protein